MIDKISSNISVSDIGKLRDVFITTPDVPISDKVSNMMLDLSSK